MRAATPLAVKPLRGGDAHTSTPVRRRPAVSSSPSARFAFCTALPAAPLPRLSIAQTTIGAARRAILVERDLGRVGVLHARELRRDALVEHAHRRRVGVRVLEQRAQVAERLRRSR